MNLDSLKPQASKPFPVTGHFRDAAATAPAGREDDSPPAVETDPVEQELVDEQRERDRNASLAVDPNSQDRPSS